MVARQVRCEDLMDTHRSVEVAKPVLAMVGEIELADIALVEEQATRLGDQDLATVADREQPRQLVQRGSEEVVAARLDGPLLTAIRTRNGPRSAQLDAASRRCASTAARTAAAASSNTASTPSPVDFTAVPPAASIARAGRVVAGERSPHRVRMPATAALSPRCRSGGRS